MQNTNQEMEASRVKCLYTLTNGILPYFCHKFYIMNISPASDHKTLYYFYLEIGIGYQYQTKTRKGFDLKIILVTFNGGKPLNNIAFVPGNCEVINLENEEQFFRVWDSGFEEPSAGMCQDNPNPLGFTVLKAPTESNAFYGLTYRGKILVLDIRIGRIHGHEWVRV